MLTMINGMKLRPTNPAGIKIVSAASGPYATDDNASKPSTGTPVTTLNSCFRLSDDFSARPKILSNNNDTL